MCGRYTITTGAAAIAREFGLREVPELPARFNVAPTQEVPVIRQFATAEPPHLQLMRWGLIPSWAKEPGKGPLLINARADTVAEKPSYRGAFKQRRCLMPADGFYEWLKAGKQRLPHYFRRRDHQPFAFAGIWEHWVGPEGHAITSCALVTTDANELVASVHDRMPVILPHEAYATWLDPQQRDPATLLALLRPFPADAMEAYAVATGVNTASHDAPDCIVPVATPAEG